MAGPAQRANAGGQAQGRDNRQRNAHRADARRANAQRANAERAERQRRAEEKERRAKDVNAAAKGYKKFKDREKNSGFFTAEQLQERDRVFLETHIPIFDEYYSFLNEGEGSMELSEDARDLAIKIAMAYPNSATGSKINILPRRRAGNQGNQNGNANQGNVLQGNAEAGIAVPGNAGPGNVVQENAGPGNAAPGNAGQNNIDLQATVFKIRDRRKAGRAVLNENLDEDQAQNQNLNGLQQGLTEEQSRNIRLVFAWLYRTTKKHHRFVDGISSRSPWEKLLICYIVERGKRHNLGKDDLRDLTTYTPNRDAFETGVKYKKHWYKKGENDINWDLISDASAMAYRLKGSLAQIGTFRSHEQEQNALAQAGGQQQNNQNAEVNVAHENNQVQQAGENHQGQQVQAEENNQGQQAQAEENNQEQQEHLNQQQVEVVAENMDGIVNVLQQLQDILDDPNLNEAMFDELNAGLPAGKRDIKALNDEVQLRTKYVGSLRQFVGVGQNFLKDYKADIDKFNKYAEEHGLEDKKSYFDHFKLTDTITKSTAAFLDSFMTAFNIINVLSQGSGLVKSFSATRWRDLLPKMANVVNAMGGLGKSGLGATTTVTSLTTNATWVASSTVKATSGVLGIATGGLTAGIGLYNFGNSWARKSQLNSVKSGLMRESRNLNNNDEVSAEQKAKRRGTDEMIMNVISVTQKAESRNMLSAGLQTIQGGLTTAAGVMGMATPATLGLTGIISLALSGTALIFSLAGIIVKNGGKGAKIRETIDKYINMDKIYADYVRKNANDTGRAEDLWLKEQGGKSKVYAHVREEVIHVLGYSDAEAMYKDITYQYAETLYNLAFFRDDGTRLTRAEVQDKKGKPVDRTKYYYGKLIMKLGLEVRYGDPPTPGVGAIYNRLLSI